MTARLSPTASPFPRPLRTALRRQIRVEQSKEWGQDIIA